MRSNCQAASRVVAHAAEVAALQPGTFESRGEHSARVTKFDVSSSAHVANSASVMFNARSCRWWFTRKRA